ncbi:uncharacterized protein LOC123562335 [Mercenaria mercenaria]|uniref:uncharacterized protein LOC123562335 n=1 Tax=Mercenaria mercenaria TaxID=6596 RepID=UPI00234E5F95|nr:uncharacterized protein LOC123562335 [Mercenaria mercenaria]
MGLSGMNLEGTTKTVRNREVTDIRHITIPDPKQPHTRVKQRKDLVVRFLHVMVAKTVVVATKYFRHKVLQYQNIIDPEGVQARLSNRLSSREYFNRGPNFLIHIDGYDKIKKYGFGIHGAICGFSRRILWLKVAHSNNNPNIIAAYFLEFVKEIRGVPRCIRMDAGTENVVVEDMQKAFRWYHGDDMAGERSVIVGSSHTNQRIECWWRQLH